ncbi:hypothetical protein BGX29_000091, partial [Mortierella sp. GBA35]
THQRSPDQHWIVHTKQAFPIQSQLFDLTGCKFKAVLKRSFQRRTASLSDSHRIIEVTAVMMANKWEESAEIRVDFMLESFKPQQPPLARLWNSQLFKDIEIRFTGGQFAPILVHKDVVLDAALKFLQVVHVLRIQNPFLQSQQFQGSSLSDFGYGLRREREIWLWTVLLQLFRDLGLPYLFQGFLPSQIQHVAQHLKSMSLWRAPELAMQGGMVNGVSALSCRDDQSQLGSTIGSFEFGEFIRAEDLSRIFDEAFKNETLD